MASYPIFYGPYGPPQDPLTKLLNDRRKQSAGSVVRPAAAGIAPDSPAPQVSSYVSIDDLAKQGAAQWLQAQIDAINAQKQAFLDDLNSQRQLEIDRGNALADTLRGLNIPGVIQNIYGNASADIGGLAQAFSGELRDQATADTARETRMVSGTGQEGAVANNGAALGDVVYGASGYIPGRNMSEQGAAFASQAALEPGFAQRIGQVQGSDVYAEGLKNLKQFTDAILEATGQSGDIQSKLREQYLKENEPNLTARTLADGRIQYFDDNTGQPVGPPQGPQRSSSSGASVKTVRLADGTYQAVDPATGKPVGNPFGPQKSKSATSTKLQARSLANGQIQWFDPTTGQPVGAPQGPKRATAKKGPGGQTYNLQLKTLSDGSQQWFDPRTGKPVGPKISPPKQKPTKRADGVTPTQLRKYKAAAYNLAKGWHDNGETDDQGKHYTWKEMLNVMVNGSGVPYDVAISQMARFSPQARKAIKSKMNALTGQPIRSTTRTASNVTEIPNAKGWDGKVVQLPTHFEGTHVTDGLGWGTKTAHDFMAPAGAPVRSPVSGTILYFRPEGAQGGGSMLIRGDDGYEYWLGHIEGGIPGGRIQAGQQIASVAHQSVSAPHVHIDRRFLGGGAF